MKTYIITISLVIGMAVANHGYGQTDSDKDKKLASTENADTMKTDDSNSVKTTAVKTASISPTTADSTGNTGGEVVNNDTAVDTAGYSNNDYLNNLMNQNNSNNQQPLNMNGRRAPNEYPTTTGGQYAVPHPNDSYRAKKPVNSNTKY